MQSLKEILAAKKNNKSQIVADIITRLADSHFGSAFKFIDNFDMIDESGKYCMSLYRDMLSEKALSVNWDENDQFESISYWNDYAGSPMKPTKEVFFKEDVSDTTTLKALVNAVFKRLTTCIEEKHLNEHVEFFDGRLLTEDTDEDDTKFDLSAFKKNFAAKRNGTATVSDEDKTTTKTSQDAEDRLDRAIARSREKAQKAKEEKEKQEAEIHYADPKYVFQDVEDSVKMLVNGAGFYGVVIAGPGGTGKSYHVEKALNDCGLTPGADWIKYKTHMTPAQIYLALLQNYNKIIVFDDCDDALLNKTTANIFKAALETNGKRVIGWNKSDTIQIPPNMPMSVVKGLVNNDKKHRMPSSFTFEGSIIFITNLPIRKVDAAVLTRCDNIDVTLRREDMAQIIKDQLPNIRISGHNRATGEEINIGTNMELKQEVYDFLMSPEYQEHMKKYNIPLNMRLFQRAYAFAHANDKSWKRRMFNIFN